MLSRKGSCVGMMSCAAAGMDRSRVGERLQAALAGLQELHLLKDKQGDMVSWALRMDQEEPVSSLHPDPQGERMMGAEEQRLEETLTALKQQLSRLRKQDVGLKTHLQQLDQQINDLKLDVNKASTEQMESDSRPSSGFYELSDGGSCSRSNSCTSVYSESLSSSQTSLIPMSPANCHISPPPQVDVCRRRSADESPTPPNPPRATGLHLGSSRIRANATCPEQTRPRPVSTGDLDRMMAQGLGHLKNMDAKKPPLCVNLKTSLMDPKFQRNLESHSGSEMYHYPSPLHAVALQSPIFFCGSEPDTAGIFERQGATGNDPQGAQMGCETKNLGYIDKVLQRNIGKNQYDTITELKELQGEFYMKPADTVNASMQPTLSAKTKNSIQQDSDQKRELKTSSSQGPTDHTSHKLHVKGPDVPYWYSHPAGMKEYSSDEVNCSSLRKNSKPSGEDPRIAKKHSDKKYGENQESRTQERKNHKQRPVMVHSTSTEEAQGFEAHCRHVNSPEFVHAKFFPAGSQKVKVRQADRKTRNMKLKRKNGEKPRTMRHHSVIYGERFKEVHAESKGEQRRLAKGKAFERVNSCQTEEHRHCSGSETCFNNPGFAATHKVHPKPHPTHAGAKISKGRRLQGLEYEQPVEQRKRRQMTRKWTLDADMFQSPCTLHHAPTAGNMQMICCNSAKSGQWIGPSRPFPVSMSTNSFFHNLDARYPPAPFNMSCHYPPRCESEYSAECASLFHSTIAESSEGEMSDNTTNRFGDSESSQSFQSLSDSDSSLSLVEGDQLDINEEDIGMVWAEAALGPTAAGRPLKPLQPRPEPPACRIKASRALKKKIRRFQPASLKVMTLV